ncbi:hypothetical protein KJZ67_03575 [Patescibacteria group bacterium]|nr:hypothetical protein [Patescibacteria group bacterium]
MILHKTILILEDDLRTLSKILDRLSVLEDDQPYQFSMVILTNYLQVENYVNENPKADFDMILLDRDCKLGGSFHVLDLERLGPEKVIAISSVPKWNEEAKKRGVTVVVEKDYKNLDTFADAVLASVEKMLRSMPPKDTDFHQIT